MEWITTAPFLIFYFTTVSIPLPNSNLDRSAQLRRRCPLKLTTSDISLKRHFKVALLIHISITTRRLATLPTGFSTFITATAFCSHYLNISSLPVFLDSLLSFSEDLSSFSDTRPTPSTSSEQYFAPIFPFIDYPQRPHGGSSVARNHSAQLWPPEPLCTYLCIDRKRVFCLFCRILQDRLSEFMLCIRTKTVASCDSCASPAWSVELEPD